MFKRSLNKLITGPGKDKNRGIFFWYSGHGHTFKEADFLSMGYPVPVGAFDLLRIITWDEQHQLPPRQVDCFRWSECGGSNQSPFLPAMENIMKRTMSLTLILVGLFFWTLAGASYNDSRAIKVVRDLSHKSGKLGTYRALIIGIDDYKDDAIPDLKTPIKDVFALDRVLRKKYGFKTALLLGRKATREAIYHAMRKLVNSSKADDSILIYYAGHGDLDRVYNDGWWIPADAEGGKPTTYLDNTVVQKAMRSMNARHVLLISDSCYSGTLFGHARAMPSVIGDKYYLDLYNEKSRWGMTSGNKTPVSDLGTADNSVFAYQLLKALNKNDKPYLSTQEIYTQIAPIVGNNSEQTPLCRPIRNTGDQGGEFVFVASSGAVVIQPVTETTLSTLSVESNVRGARVLVDGKAVGLTDLHDVEVSPGKHRIRVEKEGYVPYTKTARFKTDRGLSLTVYLDPEAPVKSSLYVETRPSDATVRILNITPKFDQGIKLAPGQYHLEVSADGHEAERQWIELEAGEDRNVVIQLKEKPAPLVISRPVRVRKGKEQVTVKGVYFNMVNIPAGEFLMGSPRKEPGRYDNEGPQHRVCISAFQMGETEVTQELWRAVMGNNPSKFKGNNNPVEQVSWNDAQAFVRKLNSLVSGGGFRLPTEAEWEYACRAGTETLFSFGKCLSTSQANYNGEYPLKRCAKGKYRKKTVPVASFAPNAWGLYDMHGNVYAWCQDVYSENAYTENQPKDPICIESGSGPGRVARTRDRIFEIVKLAVPKSTESDSGRVARGGSWYDYDSHCRSAYRLSGTQSSRDMILGIRLARTR